MNIPRKTSAGLVLASASLLAFISNWEGDSRKVYLDIVGVPTVCNGHTGPDVKLGDVWTKAQCDAVLHKDVGEHADAVLRCVRVGINQNQYEAFVSLTFNIGKSAFCNSTLVRKANGGDFEGACREILRWNRAGGRVVQGLVNRREDEYRKCIAPVDAPLVAVPPAQA